MKRFLALVGIVAAATIAAGTMPTGFAAGAGTFPRGPLALAGVPRSGRYGFLLKLTTRATLRAYDASLPAGRGAARTAATEQLASVRAAQRQVISALPADSSVLYKTHAVLAGVAVYTSVADLAALRRIGGVAAVYPIAPKAPSLSYSVPLVGAPQAWPQSATGANSTIAIIDTGVDYTHADLGGPGNPTAYNIALGEDTAPPTYPDPGKIVGGFDFAGDEYDGGSRPVPNPDPNPLDCNGHGTHVAASAAGYGENPDNSTYTGPYDESTPFETMRIGPGMAPKAKLYAYKVFGCEGTTDLVAAAIDKAADPNGDGDPSDHVNVINLSLGSDFGSPQDGDSVAANAATALGISVVASAGNAGDLYDASSSPGDAVRAIAVANSVDAYAQVDSLDIASPPGLAGAYPAQRSTAYDWTNDVDISGTLAPIGQASNRDGCEPLSSADAAAVNGKIAFLEWTDNGAARRCDSATRSANVAAAGGIGVVLADDEETFAEQVPGSASIPVVMITKSAADAIRPELGKGVTISGTSAGGFAQFIPGNDDELNASSSRGIADAGNLKPDVTGVGTSVFSAAKGTGNGGISLSGTSIASPEVAGLAALVLSRHPDWTPEEVKADIMDTAGQDLFTGPNHSGTRYAPNRVGAGRIDAAAALENLVLAYVQDDPGAVSASFGPLAVSAPTTLTKTIKLANKSLSTATYNVAYEALTSIPGVSYSVSPPSVTLLASQTKTVTVTLTVDPAQLTKPIDPTANRSQEGLPRDYLADASGRVVLTRAGQPTLRVPVYSAPRPASTMSQPASISLPAGAVQTGSLPLSGEAVDQGSGSESIRSIVAGFELQATRGGLPGCGGAITTGCIRVGDERAADLRYLGTTSNAPELSAIGRDPLGSEGLEFFAVVTQGPWRTPASAEKFDVYIDTNGDGTPDALAFNTRLPGTDVFVSELLALPSLELLDVEPIDDRFGNVDAAVFDSDVLVLPVAIGALPGVSAGNSRIGYGVTSFSDLSSEPIDQVGVVGSRLDGTLSTDVLHPGVAVYGSNPLDEGALLYSDSPGATLQVRRDSAAYAADHGDGALLFHFQNGVGDKAQVVGLDQPQPGPAAASPAPNATPPAVPEVKCVVPKLRGLPLAKTKRALATAHCKVGKVTKPKAKRGAKHGPLVVTSSKPGAGKTLPAGGKVDVTLGPKPKRKRQRR